LPANCQFPVAATASLLPDVDTSKSYAGKFLPFVSRWIERRFPHRSFTHSIFASFVLAALTYPIPIILKLPLEFVHAINIGYFLGYFGDTFTANGCEMFWPSSKRAVWPGNRAFRLRTGSQIEYIFLGFLVLILLSITSMNANGGMMTQFNRLIGSSIGVEQLYNQKGATSLLVAHIQGVMAKGRATADGDYLLVEAESKSFIVQSKAGEIYKASTTDPNAEIIITRIVADVAQVITKRTDKLMLHDVELGKTLSTYENPKMMVYVSGELKVDDPNDLRLPKFQHEFTYIHATGATVTLEYAPLKNVISQIGEHYATGYLEINIINL
jgi:inner membrane protein